VELAVAVTPFCRRKSDPLSRDYVFQRCYICDPFPGTARTMLRFLVGLILLISAVTLPPHAAARGEPPAASDDGLSDHIKHGLEDLLHPRQPTEEETERLRREQEDEMRYWRRKAQIGRELRHALDEQREYLAHVGPAFELTSVGGILSGWSPMKACLIGEAGNVYVFDAERGPSGEAAGAIDQVAFSKAAILARSIGHVKWRPQRYGTHFGGVQWQMSFDGRTTLLDVVGDLVGAHPDPRADELVKLIGDWCPNAAEIRSRIELWQNQMGLDPQQSKMDLLRPR
jgi:hypothetical protein